MTAGSLPSALVAARITRSSSIGGTGQVGAGGAVSVAVAVALATGFTRGRTLARTFEGAVAVRTTAGVVIGESWITGTTVGAGNDFSSNTCQPNSSGPDLAFVLYLPVPVDTLVIDLSNSSYDTEVAVHDARRTT